MDIITAPATVTKMAGQWNALKLSSKKRTARGATKIGYV